MKTQTGKQIYDNINKWIVDKNDYELSSYLKDNPTHGQRFIEITSLVIEMGLLKIKRVLLELAVIAQQHENPN